MRRLALIALLASACSETVTATVVHVEAQPAVHEVQTLEVVFSNESATLTETFDVDGRDFPLTFSIETPGRTGEVTMTARALDENGVLAGLGTATATIVPDDTGSATLLLDPADFVVNTAVAGSQKLAWFPEAGGGQIAAGPDGTFTVGFTDDCGSLGRCDLWARRFDSAAVAQETEIQASDQQFLVNVTDVYGNDPALAVAADGSMVAAWTDFSQILAAGITPTGASASFVESTLDTGDNPSDPSIAALSDGNFVVVWVEVDPVNSQRKLLGRFVDATGAPVNNPETGSTAAFRIDTSNGVPEWPAVAAGDGLSAAFVWKDGVTMKARFLSTSGLLAPNAGEVDLITYDGLDDIWSPRVVRAGTRFVVAWGHRTFSGDRDDGAIVVRTIATPTGGIIGAESVLARDLPDIVTRFSLAEQDGAFQIVWQACGTSGDGDDCGIRTRAFRATGLPVGGAELVDTTIEGIQAGPSITSLGSGSGAFAAAWTDDSRIEPDPSETSIRARVLYPRLDVADGTLGAICGGSGDAVCNEGLVCIAGSDSATHCHTACVPSGPPPQCPDGGVCTTAGADSACVF